MMLSLDHLLAQRIRREREARGWSIAALATESGVSRAMISKIERAEASPTAALLGRLSGALGLTISALLARAEADAGGSRVTRAATQERWTDPETGYRRRALSPSGTEPELVEVELPPGAHIAYPAASYRFLRGQVVWVLAGRLLIREGTQETELHPGDVLAYDLATPRDCEFNNPCGTDWCRYVVTLTRK
ncbi:XRE family transcriptional regulator [Sediminicoccus sp. KRV36]|uniref:helix-turn-helix domain-containing protein n=1 Tax=Sediminicoccus sp. KRV36 TaxID=3133721 RepID=UPI00200C674E|nr:XRE family transcriptional regulator [Sediminicoccus rosea]UPY36857.1 XRE family transcriptional regulator [Sediminicoccus rosea]